MSHVANVKGDSGILKNGRQGLFKKHLFRNFLGLGMIFGGVAGWFFSRESNMTLFCTIMGMFGGVFLGFFCAMYASD